MYVTGTLLLAASEMYRLADEFSSDTARSLDAPAPLLAASMTISDQFPRIKAPGTGRTAVQLIYAKQHSSGEICREIDRTAGIDFGSWVNTEGRPLYSEWAVMWGQRKYPITYRGREAPQVPPKLTLDAMNHPIMAWAEMESFRVTGDKDRLSLVYLPLVKYYDSLQMYIRQGNKLYMTDWASMDNSPRLPYIQGGGCAVDTSSEMVLYAREMMEMAKILGKQEDLPRYEQDCPPIPRRDLAGVPGDRDGLGKLRAG